MARDCGVALPRGAMGLSAVCDCGFPDHTHLLFLKTNENTTQQHLNRKLTGPIDKSRKFDTLKWTVCSKTNY